MLPHNLPVVIFLLVGKIPRNIGKERVSKCMQNHIKAQEYLEGEAVVRHMENEDDGHALDIFTVVNEASGECVKSQKLPQSYAEKCKSLKFEDDMKTEPSFLTDFNNGRLGNQLSSFASVFGLSKVNGIRPMLTHRCKDALSLYFNSIDLPVLEETYCNPCARIKFHNLRADEALPPLHYGQAYKMAEAYSNLVPTYAPLIHKLKKMLTFRSEFQTAAQSQLTQALKALPLDSPTFVGVHNRRTDFKSHMKNGYGADLVGPAYFTNALQLFRRTLQNTIFIVVTDDIPWAQRHISGPDVFFPEHHLTIGDTDREKIDVGVDLALLAACNHTIVTYGTFGFWGALLSGGATMMSTQAVLLRDLVEEAHLNNFVFVDENKDWQSYEEDVKSAIKHLN